ncbi:hypothetical protein Glove_103g285 [Diversispora epigaea]|uniref:Uncharacterized protein n=1 Tax=Diversispora epigaea TaxID=1348612 RepID=A0A397JDM6_9GLOM|nr:hypothetical protein Glove_103g285 [Diversispora epigaea]
MDSVCKTSPEKKVASGVYIRDEALNHDFSRLEKKKEEKRKEKEGEKGSVEINKNIEELSRRLIYICNKKGTTEGSNRHLVLHHGLYSIVLTTSACENRHIGNVATLRC